MQGIDQAARIKDPDPEVRLAAIEELIAGGDASAHPILVRSLFDEDKRIKRRCGEVLAKLGATGMVALFEKMLAAEKPWMREAAAMGMGQFSAAALVPLLERIARGTDASLARHALASLTRQSEKGNAAATAALATLSPPPVKSPAVPRGGAGRAKEDSLGNLKVNPPAPDAYDLEPPPPRRTRQVAPVKPEGMFQDMPPIAGPGVKSSGAQPALKDCPVCGDPTPVNAFRCPNCKEQLRPDAPEMAKPRSDPAAIAPWNARGCASLADTGYGVLFTLLSGFIPFTRGWGGFIYNLFKDGMPGGQSWGKARYRCRVVDATTGQPASYGQSIARNLTFMLPPIGLVEVILVCTSGIRIGDRIANTRVVGGDPDANFFYMLFRLFILLMLALAGFGALMSVFVR